MVVIPGEPKRSFSRVLEMETRRTDLRGLEGSEEGKLKVGVFKI